MHDIHRLGCEYCDGTVEVMLYMNKGDGCQGIV